MTEETKKMTEASASVCLIHWLRPWIYTKNSEVRFTIKVILRREGSILENARVAYCLSIGLSTVELAML